MVLGAFLGATLGVIFGALIWAVMINDAVIETLAEKFLAAITLTCFILFYGAIGAGLGFGVAVYLANS